MLHTRITAPGKPDPTACRAQIDRIAESALFQGSEGLCRLMEYLAEHALNFPGKHLKEYQIAIEALGRPAGFDPHSDSSVRVQVGRLRNKLAEYYSSLGADDPILIEVPKGRYSLRFQNRCVRPEDASASHLVPVPVSTAPATRFSSAKGALIVVALLVIAMVAMAALGSISRRSRATSAAHPGIGSNRPQTALEEFWSPFVHGPEQPFVVFKNASFVGNADIGMRRFDSSRDNPNQLIEHYTGVGEVMGVLELDQLFSKFGSHFRIKRAGLFTVDDARDNNLIFIGPPNKNLSLDEIPSTREFVLRRIADGPHRYKRVIVDNHPRRGVTDVYAAPSSGHPVEVGYAVVALERGLNPSHWTLYLEGTSTMATEGAVDFVCNEDSIGTLLNRLHVLSSANLMPFETLLRVKIANDVPLESQLLELRLTGH